MKCLKDTEGATECAHARTQEVRSILGETQKMRVDTCTTNVRCNVSGVDSDWARDLLGRKSTTGVIF